MANYCALVWSLVIILKHSGLTEAMSSTSSTSNLQNKSSAPFRMLDEEAANTSEIWSDAWYESNWREQVCDQIPYGVLKCHSNRSIAVLSGNCATHDEGSSSIEVGKCIYNFNGAYVSTDTLYTKITRNQTICEEFNRTGALCGRCKDGHYPLAYSYDMNCVECPDGKSNWWKFVLAAFLPLTVFYFTILLFEIKIASSYLEGFILYSQVISITAICRVAIIAVRKMPHLQIAVKFFASVYGIWNLDFLRSINNCLGTDALQTLALDLAMGVYPLLLMVLSYLLIDLYDRNFRPLVITWKPFLAIFHLFRRNWDVRTSLVDAFSAFLVLSSGKFLSASCNLLTPVKVYQLNSTGNLSHSLRVYYNASLPYFGEEHLPYAVLAIAVLLLFVLLPALLLIFYPFHWFQKCLNFFPVRWYVLHTFMDSFQGCYKDGTQSGTRDCRLFSSLFFILRSLMYIIGLFTLNSMYYPLTTLLLILSAITIVVAEPFKESHHTDSYTIFLLNLALSHVFIIGLNEAGQDSNNSIVLFLCVGVLAAVLPLLYISAISLHWMYRHMRFGPRLIRRLRAWRDGYETLN